MPLENVVEATVLGLLQGITEFLPISSSGHLVLFQYLFGVEEPELFFTVVLHVATMAATVIFFRKDLKEIAGGAMRREECGLSYVKQIVIASIPTMVIGLIVANRFTYIFSSVKLVRFAFLATALVLFVPSYLPLKRGGGVTGWRAVLIGTVQGISVVPGFSRSGWTIVAGAVSGVDFAESFRFSFLLSIPAISGAMALNLAESNFSTTYSATAMVFGFVAAFFSGYASLGILKRVIVRMKLHYFGYYLMLLFLLMVLFTG